MQTEGKLFRCGGLGEAHILHPERLLLEPLNSQNVFYGNAAQSALSWR